jgi:hypothetical protein
MKEIDTFLETWEETDTRTKQAFMELKDHILAMEDVTVEFIARPGVSYSLRPKHANQTERTLFAMADVIDDDPSERWLSVCFYGDMVTDPDEEGDLIPEGLLGSDGYCFDLDEYEEKGVAYIKERLNDAYKAAKAS